MGRFASNAVVAALFEARDEIHEIAQNEVPGSLPGIEDRVRLLYSEGVNWVAVWILVYPLIVPMSTWRTVWSTLLTAATVPATLLLSAWIHGVPESIAVWVNSYVVEATVPLRVDVEVLGRLCGPGKGVVPVVLWTTDTFDAASVDHASVRWTWTPWAELR